MIYEQYLTFLSSLSIYFYLFIFECVTDLYSVSYWFFNFISMKQYVPYTRLNNSTSAPSLNFVSQLTPRSFTGLAPQPLSSPRPVGNVVQEAYHSKLNLAKGRDNQLSFSGRFEESPLASLNMKKSNSQLISNISSPPLIM